MNPQPPFQLPPVVWQSTATPAAPATPEEIAALRDALAKATPGEWFSWYVAASQISGSHPACGTGFGRVQGPQMVQLDKSEAYTPSDAEFIALAHNLAPKLLAALDAAERRAKAQDKMSDAMGREITRLKSALDATLVARVDAEAEITRLKAGGCARDQRTTQYCAEAVELQRKLDAAEAQAVEFAWDALAFASVDPAAISTNTDYSVYQCLTTASVKAAEYLTARGLLRKTGERTWQRVEGGKS